MNSESSKYKILKPNMTSAQWLNQRPEDHLFTTWNFLIQGKIPWYNIKFREFFFFVLIFLFHLENVLKFTRTSKEQVLIGWKTNSGWSDFFFWVLYYFFLFFLLFLIFSFEEYFFFELLTFIFSSFHTNHFL